MKAFAAVAALIAAVWIGAGSVAAAPDNKNSGSLEVSCELLGNITVSFIEHSSGATAFDQDGRVLVAVRFTGEADITITVNGEVVQSFTDQFEAGAKGKGLQGRVQPCVFSEQFEEVFVLDEDAVAELGLDPSFIGQTATLSGTFTGVAWAMTPGR